MKANPGGQIDSADIVGRDAVISELWERLAQQICFGLNNGNISGGIKR